MRKIHYYLACASVNMDDLFPLLVKEISDNQPNWSLACDWPNLSRHYKWMQQNAKFKTPGEELAARMAIRDVEMKAITNCDVFILAPPISNGSMFEYGLAVGCGQRVMVYSMSSTFIEGEAGHFLGLQGTMLVMGDTQAFTDAVNAINLDIFAGDLAR